MRVMIRPTTPLATASGLMMVSVRSRAMSSLLPVTRSGPVAEDAGHRGAHLGRAPDRSDAGCLQGAHLLGGGSPAPGDDGARVSHAPPGRRRLAADEPDDGLGHLLPHELGRLL